MTANPFAALLRDVSRYNGHYRATHGEMVRYSDVLAALAAVPADLAEAGKVLEGVTPGRWKSDGTVVFVGETLAKYADGRPRFGGFDLRHSPDPEANARFIAWCREGVPALLARIAAQQAQIKGLDQKVNGLCDLYSQASEQVQSAGAALTAERAKVAKLVEAGKDALIVLEEFHIGPESPVIAALRAAITEAGQ